MVMWKSRDGSRLILPNDVLASMAGKLREGRGTGCGGCAKHAVADEMRRIVSGARRAGTLRSRRTGRKYRVFDGRRRSQPVRIFTRPAYGAGNVIVGVDPDPSVWIDDEPRDDDGDGDGETVLELLIGR